MPRMFLNGTAMAGGPDHHLVGDSRLVARTATAPKYRFHAVEDRYPALEPVGDGGASIAGELYDITYEQLRDVLLPAEPPGLELGVIELVDGGAALAMVLRRPYAGPPARRDITACGSWRAYRAAT
ncbi:MAG: allophanate hydrolase-related protein [Actinomycetota bacterium]